MNQSVITTWLGISGAIFVGVILIGTSIEVNAIEKANRGGVDRAIRKYNGAKPIYIPPAVYADGANVKGTSSENALMTIIKFSDFQCPACRSAAQAIKPFFLRNKDKIRFIYRNYPLDSSCNSGGGNHAMACESAYAAICAGKQGKFYEMHDLLFDGQRLLSKAYITDAAKMIDLDVEKFSSCIADPETKKEVEQDISWGEGVQLQATPTFIVNGRRIEGGFTMMQWEALLKGLEKARSK